MVWRRTLLMFPVFIGLGVIANVYLNNQITPVGIGGMLGQVTSIWVMANLFVLLVRKSGRLEADGVAVRVAWMTSLVLLVLIAMGGSGA